MSNLDKDFDNLVKQMNAKIKEASKVFADINKLLKKSECYSLGELVSSSDCKLDDGECSETINLTPLFDEFEKIGWDTSSMMC